jgi:hypothetical protein
MDDLGRDGMPHLWTEVRSPKNALAGSFELLALRAWTLVTRHLRGNDVATVFAYEVSLLGDHDLELVQVNTVRTAYGVHLGFASGFLLFLSLLGFGCFFLSCNGR